MAFFSATTAAPTTVMPHQHDICSLPDLPAPSFPPSCEEEWKRSASSIDDTVIYGLAWRGQYLVAVTSSGNICIWNIPSFTDDDQDLDKIERLELFQKTQSPVVKVQVSSGVLYSVHFTETSQQRTLLLVSGDDGVLGYDWRTWLELVSEGGGGTKPPPEPILHCKPHRSMSTVEINDFSVSENGIFGAAGDANAYKWDVETSKILACYPAAKRGYLHTIQCMPNDNTVLMGGEDGILGIWDGHHDKLIDNINLQTVMQKDSSLVEKDDSVSNSNTALDASKSSLWISHIHSPSEHWWTVCGGIEHSAAVSPLGSSSAATSPGGHVTSWHAPTRSLVAGCLTREMPQHQCSMTGTLVTIANEGVVSHWTPSRLQRTGRAWCSPPSCFAASIGSNNNVLAVGGVGSQVDIFDNVVDSKSYSLTLE